MAADNSNYVVLERQGPFEVRRYAALILAETYVDGELAAAGREGYRRLLSYLSGDNRARREIDCPVPVLQAKGPQVPAAPAECSPGLLAERSLHAFMRRHRARDATGGQRIARTVPMAQTPCGTGYSISFVLPSRFTMLTLPLPSNPAVTLRQLPERIVAALRYRGSWGAELFDRRRQQLEAFIRARGLEPTGAARLARYNPPYVPWFLRRNEVLIPVAGFPVGNTDRPCGEIRPRPEAVGQD